MDNSKPRPNDHLGVNKMGKNIKKSPLHQPNFTNNTARPQPQPQVYNISKNDFRSIVQQLTGSPSRESLPRPPQNSQKPQNTRLQKVRPAPLTQINRPPQPPPVPVQPPATVPPPQAPYNTSLVRQPAQFGQPSPRMMPPMIHGDSVWANTAESPVSAYMRYLQSSFMDSGHNANQYQPPPHHPPHQPPPHQPQLYIPGQPQTQLSPPGLVPNQAMLAPQMPNLPSPRFNGLALVTPYLPSPRMNGPVSPMPNLPSPRFSGPVPPMPGLPSPQNSAPGLLPSPTSQFLLPSPSGYTNLFSPRSPYPLLSPGVQFPPPLSPNFSFSPYGQWGMVGSGPQPPPSPGLMFPWSPSGLFPFSSPRWRDQ